MVEDVRVYKTKKNIADALIHLLEEKDFAHITVKDICTLSLSSKSTFYSHFIDKYDLLEKLVQLHAASFEQEISRSFDSMKQGNVAEVIEMIVEQTVKQNAEISTLLNVHVPSADLHVEFEKILYQTCLSFLEKEVTAPAVSMEYLARLYAANAMVLLHWTLQHGKDEHAIDLAYQMQRFIFDLIS